jgi:hypothetical protein
VIERIGDQAPSRRLSADATVRTRRSSRDSNFESCDLALMVWICGPSYFRCTYLSLILSILIMLWRDCTKIVLAIA